DIIFRLGALLEKRSLVCFQLCNGLSLFARSLLPFFFDLFYSFFDLRDSKCHFFLLQLQLFKRDDLAAQLGEIGRLRSAFASEVDFTFLEKTPFVTKRDARPLAPHLQRDLAKPCADETHGLRLSFVIFLLS